MAIGTESKGKLGYAEYCSIPNDGQRHEIINGDHFVNAAPNPYHQLVSINLANQLYTQITSRGLGLVFAAPIDVQLSDHDIVQPDLVVVLNAKKKAIITPTKIKGVPDLLVEIISPSSSQYDCTTKKELYERSGVPQYWIVDPFEHTLDQFVLRDGKYQLQPAAANRPASIINDAMAVSNGGSLVSAPQSGRGVWASVCRKT